METEPVESNVQSVNASSGGLVKATLGAAIVAGAILTFAWLPAEHGIDPTGVGHLLGLTEMGHIKEQLHSDADADAAAAAAATTTTTTDSAIHQKLDAIQNQLDALSISVGAMSVNTPTQTAAQNTTAPTTAPIVEWRDEIDHSLAPGEGIEFKLVMNEGSVAEFEWTANGAVLNHDTHGDGDGQSISYEKGRSVPEQTGQLSAAFTGNHGWYWRNRTDTTVVLTLRTRGDYTGTNF